MGGFLLGSCYQNEGLFPYQLNKVMACPFRGVGAQVDVLLVWSVYQPRESLLTFFQSGATAYRID